MTKRNTKGSSKRGGISFTITLISVSIIFIFLGYLMGQYVLMFLTEREVTAARQEQHNALDDAIDEKLAQLTVADSPQVLENDSALDSIISPTVSSSTSTGLYRVQAGAFSQVVNAERVASDLKNKGFEALITSGPPYRVQSGAFSTHENAERHAAQLRIEGFEVVVIQP